MIKALSVIWDFFILTCLLLIAGMGLEKTNYDQFQVFLGAGVLQATAMVIRIIK